MHFIARPSNWTPENVKQKGKSSLCGKKNCGRQSANNQVRDKVTEKENHGPLQLHHETMGGMLILSECTEIIKL